MKSTEIRTIPSNRIMVKKLPLPGKSGSFYVPEHLLKQKNRKAVWYGQVAKFGLDTNAMDAYGLKELDLIAVDPIELSADTLRLDDGEFVFIEKDNIVAKDDGAIAALYPELFNKKDAKEAVHA